jgi:hypothetical protein
MKRSSGLRAVLAVAAVALCMRAVAGPRPQVAVEPDHVAYGQAATVTVRHPPLSRAALTPWQPRRLRTLAQPAQAVAVSGTAVVTAGQGGLTFLAADATRHTPLGHFAVHGTCTRLRVWDTRVFTACGAAGLWGVDIGTPAQPTRTLHLATGAVTDFAVTDDYVYVLAGGTVTVYSRAAGATDPVLARATLTGTAHAVAAQDRSVFIAQDDGLAVYRLDDDGRLTAQARYRTTGPALDITLRDGLAYLALGGAGVLIMDVNRADHPRWVGSHHRLGRVLRVWAVADRVYALNTASVIYAVDSRNPARLSIDAARRWTAPVTDLAVDAAGRVWVVTADRLDVMDFGHAVPAYSNEIFDVGEGVNFGGIRRGVIVGDIVYVADWFSGIHLFDISDPLRPRLLSSLHIPGSPKGIVVRDGTAFVADDDHGLQVIDVRDSRRPHLIAHLQTAGLGYTPFLVGDRLYLASHRGGFQIIDVSDVSSPRELANYFTPSKAWSIQVDDGIAYVADDAAGLLVLDVRDPTRVTPIASFDPGGDAEDVVLRDGYAFVAFFDRGLYILDVHDPRHPRQVSHLPTPGNARGIELHGDKAYVADWLAGLHVVDIQDLAHPRILGTYDTDGAAWGVRVKDGYAYVMDWWGGFTVVDVSDPARPRLAARYHDRGTVRQITAHDKFIYAAYGAGGLQVFDIKNPLNPIWVTGLDGHGSAAALWLRMPYLFLASKGDGLTAVDARDPYNLRVVGGLKFALDHPLLQGDDRGYLYLYNKHDGVTVIDATHPEVPRRVAVIGTEADALWIMHRILYVATPRHGVEVYDVSDPSHPQPRAQLPEPAPVTALGGTGDRLFVAVAGRGLYAVKVSGDALRETARFPLADIISDIAVRGDRLLATRGDGGLWELAVAKDGALHSLAFYPILHPSTRVGIGDRAAYVAGGTTPTAVAWLPDLAAAAPDAGDTRLTLPKDLPQGRYDITLIGADGQTRVTPGALTVALPQRNAPAFTMEDFQKALKKLREEQAAPAPQ